MRHTGHYYEGLAFPLKEYKSNDHPLAEREMINDKGMFFISSQGVRVRLLKSY